MKLGDSKMIHEILTSILEVQELIIIFAESHKNF